MTEPAACPFCRIASGVAEADRLITRDGLVMAFADIAPINEGHLLIAPLAHIPQLAALDESTGAAMFGLARRCAAALRASSLRCDGVNLFLNDGATAGQTVDHVHMHVLPRFPGDAFEPARRERPTASAGTLAVVANELRAHLADQEVKSDR